MSKEINYMAGYAYCDAKVKNGMESARMDSHENLGWVLDGTGATPGAADRTTPKDKRARIKANKAELTRLQRQFDTNATGSKRFEQSKTVRPSVVALAVAMEAAKKAAGAVLQIILAVFGLLGWGLPYWLIQSVGSKKSALLFALVGQKYDVLYALRNRANRLLTQQAT